MNEVTSKYYINVAALANAVQASFDTIKQISGGEIASDVMTNTELTNALAAKINSYLMNPSIGENK